MTQTDFLLGSSVTQALSVVTQCGSLSLRHRCGQYSVRAGEPGTAHPDPSPLPEAAASFWAGHPREREPLTVRLLHSHPTSRD